MSKFDTIDGEAWKKSLKAARKRRKKAKERIEKQLEEFKTKPTITENGI